jgi:hypothetical protein
MKSLFPSVAALLVAILPAGEAHAMTASQAQIANAAHAVLKVDYRGHRHHRHYGGPDFRHWCAYNCYAVSPCSRGCFGHYHYSRYSYDQDIPMRYRYDREASPTDNALALAYPITGEPVLRLFERTY